MKKTMSNDDRKELLSQEEIDALINDEDSQEESVTEDNAVQEGLTDNMKDVLGEVGNIAMGSAATALYTILDQKVDITTPNVRQSTITEIMAEYERPCVLVQVEYVEGIEGMNILIIKEEDAAIIADLMMGGDGSNVTEDLDDIHLSAVCEAMNQMMGSAATSMSSIINEVVNISPPEVEYIEVEEVIDVIKDYFDSEEPLVDTSFRLKVGDLIDSSFKQISKLDFSKRLVAQLMKHESGLAAKDWDVDEEKILEGEIDDKKEETKVGVDSNTMRTGGESQMANSGNVTKGEQTGVKRAQFPDFDSNTAAPLPHNMELIQDVPLQVTVQLGKNRMTIKQILELGEGSIVELDKLAGEPVDLLVNGKLVAKGEVVVIDESFGFRVKDIISPMDRINNI